MAIVIVIERLYKRIMVLRESVKITIKWIHGTTNRILLPCLYRSIVLFHDQCFKNIRHSTGSFLIGHWYWIPPWNQSDKTRSKDHWNHRHQLMHKSDKIDQKLIQFKIGCFTIQFTVLSYNCTIKHSYPRNIHIFVPPPELCEKKKKKLNGTIRRVLTWSSARSKRPITVFEFIRSTHQGRTIRNPVHCLEQTYNNRPY